VVVVGPDTFTYNDIKIVDHGGSGAPCSASGLSALELEEPLR
jgi:hypothetical protein